MSCRKHIIIYEIFERYVRNWLLWTSVCGVFERYVCTVCVFVCVSRNEFLLYFTLLLLNYCFFLSPGFYLTDEGCEACNTSGILGPIVVGVIVLIVIAGCVLKKGRKGAFDYLKAKGAAVKDKHDDIVAKKDEMIAKVTSVF